MTEHMTAFLVDFELAGARARRFVERPARTMLGTIERQAPPLRQLGLRFFDDLIGRELGHLDYLLGLEIEVGKRDYVELSST